MKATNFQLIRYDADDGFLFDWKEPRYIEQLNEETNQLEQIQEHLLVKTLFIGGNDTIDNYIEVAADGTDKIQA